MKKLILLSVFLTGLVKIQAQFDCPAPDSVKDKYLDDARFNSVIYAEDKNDTWKDSINFNPELVNRYLGAMMAAYSDKTHPFWSKLFGAYPIHESTDIYSFNIVIDKDQDYAKQMYEKKPTGNTTFDSLFTMYHFDNVYTYAGSAVYEAAYTAKKPMNTLALRRKLLTMPGVNYVSIHYCYSYCNTEVFASAIGQNMRLIYNIGSGDCPAGCTIWDSYEYIITPDCKIESSTYRPTHYTGIGEVGPKFLQISPNPAKEVISLSTTESFNYHIIDQSSRIVKAGSLSPGTSTLEINDLAPGFYLIQLNNEHETETQRFIKE